MATKMEENRRTDLWPVLKRNAVALVTVGGLIIAIVTVYNMVLYHNTILNPQSVAKFQAEKAKAKADLEALKKLGDQRHCLNKAWFSGASPETTLKCLD